MNQAVFNDCIFFSSKKNKQKKINSLFKVILFQGQKEWCIVKLSQRLMIHEKSHISLYSLSRLKHNEIKRTIRRIGRRTRLESLPSSIINSSFLICYSGIRDFKDLYLFLIINSRSKTNSLFEQKTSKRVYLEIFL